MAEAIVLAERLAVLKSWSENLPRRVAALLADQELNVGFYERHGTWILQIIWETEQLSRAAELGLTNSESLPDLEAKNAYLSVRSSASNTQYFVVESLFERRRATSRMKEDELEDLLKNAVHRALEYNVSSLRDSYLFGARPG